MSIVLMPDDIAVRRETVLRMSRTIASTLAAHMRQDSHNEQMAFGLAKQVDTVDGTEFLLDELLLPGPEDLASQSAGGICPTRSCQGVVYLLAQQARKSIVEFHTHPGPGRPHFSSTDAHFAQWDYLHFDQFTGKTIPASTIRDPECPQCGQTGYLLAGDPGEHKTDSDAKIRRRRRRRTCWSRTGSSGNDSRQG